MSLFATFFIKYRVPDGQGRRRVQIVNSLASAPILEEVHVVGRPGPGLGLRPHRVGARDRRQVEEGRHFVLAGKQTSAETIWNDIGESF